MISYANDLNNNKQIEKEKILNNEYLIRKKKNY